MKVFSVYHAAPIRNTQGRITGIHGAFGWEPSVFPDEFIHVADITTGNLDTVFMLTQNDTLRWLDQPYVVRRNETEARSTSVGDIIRQGAFVWVVAPMGFNIIPMAGTDRIVVPAQYTRV